MATSNEQVAAQLNRLADLLEIKGDNPFRVRAYRSAAAVVAELPGQLAEMIDQGASLAAIPGIGRALEEKIRHLVATGRLELLAETEQQVPPTLLSLAVIPGLGPKKIGRLHRELGVTDLAGLARVAAAGDIQRLRGFGAKTEQQILREARAAAAAPPRTLRPQAEATARALLNRLRPTPGLAALTVAGSFRRRVETVGDLDLLAVARDPAAVSERFTTGGQVARVIARGRTKSSIQLASGLQVDLRVVPRASYGAALHYFTGSKAHNIAIRRRALDRGLKINEYGVYSGRRAIAGRSETEIYRRVDLPFIPPELRENRGEIEAAAAGRLPALLTVADIRSDLHVHTTYSDGRHDLPTLLAAAAARGLACLAVCDHSRGLAMANGLDADALARQGEEIDRLRETSPVRILKGIEVEILPDGRLDLPEAVLEKLDIVVAAVHSSFHLDAARQTNRLIRAMDNPLVNIIAHPTGRLINRRRPCALEMERLAAAAAARGCWLEVNAHPLRLDLNDSHCRLAAAHGAALAISSDAHRPAELDNLRHGVAQARRGWLEAKNVVSTLEPEALLALVARRRSR